MCTYAIFLGLRLTLRPRLYAAARIRGLRTRQNAGNDKALLCRPHSWAEDVMRHFAQKFGQRQGFEKPG